MPRFFFDIHDSLRFIDTEGMEIPSVEDAQAQAMQIASAYAGSPKMLGETGGAIVVTVRSDEDAKALTVRFAFNVEVG